MAQINLLQPTSPDNGSGYNRRRTTLPMTNIAAVAAAAHHNLHRHHHCPQDENVRPGHSAHPAQQVLTRQQDHHRSLLYRPHPAHHPPHHHHGTGHGAGTGAGQNGNRRGPLLETAAKLADLTSTQHHQQHHPSAQSTQSTPIPIPLPSPSSSRIIKIRSAPSLRSASLLSPPPNVDDERMYDMATWRMYHRIMEARIRRQRMEAKAEAGAERADQAEARTSHAASAAADDRPTDDDRKKNDETTNDAAAPVVLDQAPRRRRQAAAAVFGRDTNDKSKKMVGAVKNDGLENDLETVTASSSSYGIDAARDDGRPHPHHHHQPAGMAAATSFQQQSLLEMLNRSRKSSFGEEQVFDLDL